MVSKTKEDKRRKWILTLGFSEAEADSFIEFVVPNWKIEALAEVLHKPEPAPESVPEAPEVRDSTEAKPDSVAPTETAPAAEVGVETPALEAKK